MSNINDYLRWRGDIPINKNFNINDLDNLVLARFSYLIFNKIDMNSVETIESISAKMKDFDNESFRYNGDKEMITLLGQSPRFKNMLVTDFIEITDLKAEKQFSAITIHISEKELYVSFIGTDNSIVGWKEDFNMAFMESVPAQLEGEKYLKMVSKKYPKSKIRIGGHSKGGSIAIFSAVTATKEIQNKIINVCNYDGPGLGKEILDNIVDSDIIKKLHTFIPQDSVIGRILEHKEKCSIVKSIEKGLYQHDIFSWQVLRDNFIYVDNVTSNSQFINNSISTWLKSTSAEQRKIFFDGVFQLFYSSEASTFSELSASLGSNIPTFIKTYRELSDEEKKLITTMLKEFGKIYMSNFKQSEKLKLRSFENDYHLGKLFSKS